MQHFLWLNREALEPYFELRMMRHFKPVVRLAGTFSRKKNPLHLLDMVGLLDESFDEFPVRNDRDLLMSAEGLCGHLPGANDVTDYSATPILMTYLAGYLVERFPDAQVKVLLTTRNAYDWLFSAYRQHLRGHRMIMDFSEFEETFREAANMYAIISEVAEVLAPLPVMFMPMSDALRHPLGPGAALVDQMNVPEEVRASLTPVGKGNEGPSDALWQQFLKMNRADNTDTALTNRKNNLADAAGLGGWKAF